MHVIKKHLWLIVALCLMIFGGIFAQLFHTSFHSVTIEDVRFETENGYISGLLYIPRGVDEENPAPAVVTTHGYLNSREMQDLNAIELSRRGYIVLAIDMYDHGNSRWSADIPVGGQFGTFWIHAQSSGARFMFEHPYVARDASGNGRIGVTGHSMGGFSSVLAMYFDELQALASGVRMIEAGLVVGADLSFASSVAPPDQLIAGFGSRPVGFIAGIYDEFFFNDPVNTERHGGSVLRADWTQTPMGAMFLGTENGEPGVRYTVETNVLLLEDNPVREPQVGERIIYVPHEIHPWNHFSATSVDYMIDFFSWAMPLEGGFTVSGQIWQWKVLFNFVTLIGFFMLVVPVMSLLLKIPFFATAITTKHDGLPADKNNRERLVTWISIIIGVGLPAYLIPTLMERRPEGIESLAWTFFSIAILATFTYLLSSTQSKKTKDEVEIARFNTLKTGGSVIAALAIIGYLISRHEGIILPLSGHFVAPTVNVIGFWALISAAITSIILTFVHFVFRNEAGARLENYGLSTGLKSIGVNFIVAAIGVLVSYAMIFVIHSLFTVDARVWVFAVPTFNFQHFMVALRYIPFFFLFYYVNTISVNANTREKKYSYVLAVIQNIAGLVIWLAFQYGSLFIRGVGAYPTMALNAVLVIGLVPVLVVAAIFARALFEKTNNVYLAAFTNTFLFTLISVANTAVFYNLY